ncbi:MAG: PDZ domain-containing protein, partial [Chloroflexi bacterium]|nr:PDZ domain-containing protein [Chloroflexota bacterium]
MATANLTQQRQRLSPARILITLVLAGLLVGMGFVLGVVFMRVLGNGSQPSVGSLAPERPTPIPGTEPTIDREKLLDQITRLLESEYLEPDELVADDLTYGAAAGLVSAVGDPHTMFVEPVQAAIIEEDMQGSFEGIGATVNLVDGIVTIVQPMPNSPAERAGIQAGDQVLAVDDTSLEGYALLDAITLIRGPKGTVVSLLLRRAGIAEPFTVQVTRDKITVAIVESRMLDDGIAYISLSEFNGKALEQIREAWRTLSKQNPTGLVLDLRNNPGGYLH